jgi:hypothetical protein
MRKEACVQQGAIVFSLSAINAVSWEIDYTAWVIPEVNGKRLLEFIRRQRRAALNRPLVTARHVHDYAYV